MLDDLPEDTRLHRIMDYRTIDTTNKNLSKEMRDVYSALQRYYKIRAAKDQRNEDGRERLSCYYGDNTSV